jgi:N-acetylated-alpha-linked acidic dipeptidase
MTFANGSVYTAGLVEDVLEEDETTTRPDRLPSFHGYSATGNASAEFVYVGLGTVSHTRESFIVHLID